MVRRWEDVWLLLVLKQPALIDGSAGSYSVKLTVLWFTSYNCCLLLNSLRTRKWMNALRCWKPLCKMPVSLHCSALAWGADGSSASALVPGKWLLPGDVVGILTVSLPRPKSETLPVTLGLVKNSALLKLTFCSWRWLQYQSSMCCYGLITLLKQL